MSAITITRMTVEDVDKIMEIEIQSFNIPWTKPAFIAEVSSNDMAEYIVAKLDDRVVGYAGMWRVLDEGHITNIAVHPNFRRNKIGTLMVEELINIAKQHNINKLTLEVRESNSLAQDLYKKLGFSILGRRKHYYADNREDALIMWLTV